MAVTGRFRVVLAATLSSACLAAAAAERPYYACALENPSCRWSTCVCKAHAVDCGDPGAVPSQLEPRCDPGHWKAIHERAWTSPICYTPVPRGGTARAAASED